jgi:uncharacterized membrane protein YdbT with pleckstrin-like domain
MNKNTNFKCKISQIINFIPFLINAALTAVLYYTQNILVSATEEIIYLISEYYVLPEISNFILIYLFLAFLWGRFLWRVLTVYSLSYYFEDELITLEFGVFDKDYEYIEYFRIKDYSVKKPLIARIFRLNLNEVIILSTDRTHPYLKLKYLTNFSVVSKTLRADIKNATASGKGREIDVV